MIFSLAACEEIDCSCLKDVPAPGKPRLALQFLLEGERVGEKGLYITLFGNRGRVEGGRRLSWLVPRQQHRNL